MVEMVHDHIAAGKTTVVSTAAVLRCGKQMEKLPHYNFSWTVSLKNRETQFGRDYDLSRDRLILELELCKASTVLLPFALRPGSQFVYGYRFVKV
jgi:hypothetical protein